MAKETTGLGTDAKDLIQTLRDYAKQETVGPFKDVGRYVGFGLAGAVCMALATLLIMLALLRVLQTQTGVFDNNLSFLPYLFTVLALGVVIGLTVRAITKESTS
jgi:flagellar biosynthesis protein FliQ